MNKAKKYNKIHSSNKLGMTNKIKWGMTINNRIVNKKTNGAT